MVTGHEYMITASMATLLRIFFFVVGVVAVTEKKAHEGHRKEKIKPDGAK